MSSGPPATASPTWGSRLAGIDGLRAIAFTMVLAVHTWEYSGAGEAQLGGSWDRIHTVLSSGLTLFFTLSGFLLYRPFATAILHRTDAPSTSRYLRNRGLRILPAYWVILAIVALVGVATASGSLTTTGGFASPRDFLLNVVLLQGYTPSTVLTGIPPAWSLGVEIVFYLTLPLLAYWAAGLARGRTLSGRTLAVCAPAGVLLVIGMTSKLVERYPVNGLTTWTQVLNLSFLTNADLFAFGMLAAVVVSADGRSRTRFDPRWIAPVGVAVAVVAIVLLTGQHGGAIPNRFYPTVMSLACGLLVLWVAENGRQARFVRMLDARAVAFVGVVSYSAYLWHWPLTFWLGSHGLLTHGWAGVAFNLLLVGGLTIALSAITYTFVEAPALRRKARATVAGDRSQAASPWSSRERRQRSVPETWIGVLAPAFRYDYRRDAYVLRIGGERWGPELIPKRASGR